MGIDEKIKDTVVVFNLMGLPTGQSCEGHLDSGIPAPWVRIEAPNEPDERFINQNEIFKKVADKYGIDSEDVKRAINLEAWKEASIECAKNDETVEFKEWREQNEKLRERVSIFLTEFYQDRQVADSIRLQVDELGDSPFEIHNGGEDYRPITEGLTEEQKKELAPRLALYQGEMKQFTEFLRNKFFKE